MIDSYEIARGQDQDCTQNSDCDSDNNSGDGFCDNYMGYKCSTKCKNNSECIGNDGNFNYVCRSDGRCAPDEFTTVWELPIEDDNVEPNTIKLHFDENAKCQMQIDWGDNKIEELACSEVIEHKYSQEYATGTITVKIKKRSGDMTGFHVENLSVEGETKQKFCKLKKILSFGDIGLGTNAFIDCYLLDELPSVDIPNPQNLTTMERMFKNNCSLNYPLNNWDVSNVTTMNKTFWMPNCPGADNEDERISTVSSTFNQPLDRWNVSKVTIMTNMFSYLPEFNQPLDVWNVSNVTNMDGMFAGAIKFNQPLNQWNVSNVTSMEAMFYKAKKFNQELSKWNVKKVKNFKNMFQYADSFDQDLSSWKVNKEANVDGIFDGAPMSEAHLCAIAKAYYDNTFLWGTSEYWPVSFLKKLFEDYNGCPN
jgi:surface protein